MYHLLETQPQAPSSRELLTAVDSAAQKDDAILTVGLDGISSLDSPTMNGLITALRRMRNAGGTVQLHVTRPDLLVTLANTGLDRVFKVVATPDTSQTKVNRRPKRTVETARTVAGGLAAVFVTLLVLGGS